MLLRVNFEGGYVALYDEEEAELGRYGVEELAAEPGLLNGLIVEAVESGIAIVAERMVKPCLTSA